VTRDRWLTLCRSGRLAPYAIERQGGACSLIALHLSPSFHVLARATNRASDTLLDIRTDFWRCFEHIDQWFDKQLA